MHIAPAAAAVHPILLKLHALKPHSGFAAEPCAAERWQPVRTGGDRELGRERLHPELRDLVLHLANRIQNDVDGVVIHHGHVA